VVTTLPDTNATTHGLREVTVVPRITESGASRERQRHKPKVLIDTVRPNHHAGVHPVPWVPDRLEPSEKRHGGRRVHAGQQFGTHLTVTVLARQRTTVPSNEISALLKKPTKAKDPITMNQIEVDADVDAALTEMPVGKPTKSVRVQQRPKITKVGAKPRRRYRGVLPPRPGLGAISHPGGDPGPFLPQPPQRPLRGRRGQHLMRAANSVSDRGSGANPVNLNEKPGAPVRQHRRRLRIPSSPQRDDPLVQALHGQRPKRQDRGHGVGSGNVIDKPEHEQHPRDWHLNKPHSGPKHGDTRAFGADQSLGEMPPVLRQQLMQGVPGHLPPKPPKLSTQHREILVSERPQPSPNDTRATRATGTTGITRATAATGTTAPAGRTRIG
jgi:hypothetical protein